MAWEHVCAAVTFKIYLRDLFGLNLDFTILTEASGNLLQSFQKDYEKLFLRHATPPSFKFVHLNLILYPSHSTVCIEIASLYKLGINQSNQRIENALLQCLTSLLA